MTEFSGTLEGVGLPAIVRFLAGLEKTGCLRITHQDWGGEIFFDGGQIVSAALGSRKGLSALDALVQALPGAAFVFDGDAHWTTEPNITLSRDEMQAHLAELVEQSAHGGPTLPSLDVVPVVVPQDDESSADETVPLDRGTVQTLLAIDGVRSVRDIISARGSFEALWQVANLAQVGLVRLPSADPKPSTNGRTETARPGRGGDSNAAAGVAAASVAAAVAGSPVTPSRRISPVPPATKTSPGAPVTPAAPIAAATQRATPAQSAPPTQNTSAAPNTTSAAPNTSSAAPNTSNATPTTTTTTTTASNATPNASNATPNSSGDAAGTETLHCPKLGFEDDPANSFGRPTRLHRCFAAGAPLPLSLDQQRELCLSNQFGTCPRLAMAGLAPASEISAAAPYETTPASPSQPEPPTDDPRIVHLPVGGRGGSVPRVAASAEAAGAVATQPTRLRPAAQLTRETTVTQPTPLRGRPTRIGAASAAAAAGTAGAVASAPSGADAAAPPPPTAARPIVSPTEPAPGRKSAFNLPIPTATLAAAAMIVMAIAVVGVLLLPHVGEMFTDETTVDMSSLPNANAALEGTPVSELGGVRSTAVPAGAAAAGATVANPSTASNPSGAAPGASGAATTSSGAAPATANAPQAATTAQIGTTAASQAAANTPAQAGANTAAQAGANTPAAQPTAEPARPTAAAEPNAAAPPAAPAPNASRALLEESFDGNERNWPNNPQGTAWVTGGSLRVMPRQAGQFVAIAVPAVGEILQDVVVNASFRKVGGPAGGGYGIIVRDQGPAPRDGSNQIGRYYVLEVGDKGEVGIWRREGDRWIDLLPWTRSDAVKPGNGTNEVTVKAIGNTLSLSVNGTEVGTRTDDTLAVGNVGVFVGGDGNSVAVDQISVRTP